MSVFVPSYRVEKREPNQAARTASASMSRPGPGLALSQIIYEQYHRARQQYLRPREDAEPQTRAASGGAVRERLDEEQQQQPIASAEEAAAVVTLAQHTDDRHTLWAQIAPKLVMLHHMQREKTLSIADGDSRAAGGTQERARLEEVVRVLLSHYGELFMRVHSISEEALEQGEFMTRPPMTPMLADVLQRLRHHHHRHRQQDWQDMVNGMSLNGDEGHVIHEQEAGLAHKVSSSPSMLTSLFDSSKLTNNSCLCLFDFAMLCDLGDMLSLSLL